jgi:hypothetical protein
MLKRRAHEVKAASRQAAHRLREERQQEETEETLTADMAGMRGRPVGELQ